MRISLKLLAVGMTFLSASSITAQARNFDVFYEVSVTNLTRGQIISPFVVATSSQPLSVFTAGQPASPELAALAEDADSTGLVTTLEQTPGSRQVLTTSGVTMPGATTVVEVPARGGRYISMAGMLVTTNDAFTGFSDLRVRSRNTTFRTSAYDAGSEDNDESCAYIPGPPCGSAGQKSAEPGEGFVHVHPGVQGIGDLTRVHDWRNPVAEVKIRVVFRRR